MLPACLPACRRDRSSSCLPPATGQSNCSTIDRTLFVKEKSLFAISLPTFGRGRRTLDIEVVRRLCIELMSDVPADSRNALLMRLDRFRRADDLSDVRCALFDVVSRFHGESIARERIAALDAALR